MTVNAAESESPTTPEAPAQEAPQAPPSSDPTPSTPEGAPAGEEGQEPPQGPRTTEEFIAAWRKGELDVGIGQEEEGGEEEEAPAGQPRDEQGRFAPKEAAAGAEDGEESEAATEDEGESSEEPQALAVALMPRYEGEDPQRLELTPEQIETLGGEEAAREWLARTENGLMRRSAWLEEKRGIDQLRQEVQGEREQFYADLSDDARATDIIVNNLRPAVQESVLEALLAAAPEETFNRVLDTALGYSRDPQARELAHLKRRLPKEEAPAEGAAPQEEPPELPQEVRDNSKAIVDAVAQLAPESMPDDQFNAYYDDAIKGLVTYTKIHEPEQFSPDDALEALESLGVLRKHGLSHPGGSSSTNGTGSSRTAPAGGDQPGTEGEGGRDFQSRVKRRKEASAVAPAGQGAAHGQGSAPVTGDTIEERLASYRKSRGV